MRRIRKRLNTRFAHRSTRSRTTTTTATTIMNRRGRATDPAPTTKPRSDGRCGASVFSRPARRLAVDPVRQLHQEGVVRLEIEQVAQVAAEALRPLGPRRSLTALTPDHE